MRIWRFAVAGAGFSLIAVGAILLVLPGPGVVVLLLGLAVLATEFKWARDLLNKTTSRVKSGKEHLKEKLKARSDIGGNG